MAEDDGTQAAARPTPTARQPPPAAAFWRLWISSGLSNLADGIVKVVLPLVAIRLTTSPTLIAGVTFALTLPWLLFALPAGLLTDRLDRRRIMLGANTARALLLVVLTLTVLVEAGWIGVLYAVALGIGIAETLYDTSAQSVLPLMVPRDRLSQANGRLYAMEMTTNRFVGPPVGGFLVTAGVALAVATPALLWAGAVAVLLLLPGRYQSRPTRRATVRADLVEGLRFLWRHHLLRTLAVMGGVFNFALSATLAVLVLYAVGPTSAMGLSAPAYGLLLAAAAAGSLLGSLVADQLERRLGRARSLLVAILGDTLLVGAPALTADAVLVGVAFCIGGAADAVWSVITTSLRQRVTPDRLLGRVNSGHRLVAWGSLSLGAVAGGVLAQGLGLRAVFVVMGLLTLALIAGMAKLTDAAMDAAERAADHD